MFGFNLLVFSVVFLLSTEFIVNKESPQSKSKESPQPKSRDPPLTNKFYTKTAGQIRFDKIKGRTPAKGSILGCVVKCSATAGCHCIGINIETNECETVSTAIGDASEKNNSFSDKFVYFTMNGNNEGTGENLALNKKVTQSSTYNQYQATKAVDNNNKTESKTHGGKVKKSGLPWLQIDMKDEHVITGILLLTKDAESLHNFEIRVGNRQISKIEKGMHFKENPVCFGYVGNKFLENNKAKVVKCEPCPLLGQYVTIQIVNNCTDCRDPGLNALNLSEVEVYGYLPK